MRKIVKIMGVIGVVLICMLSSMPVDAATKTEKTEYTNKKMYTITTSNPKKITVNGKEVKGKKISLKKGKNNIKIVTAKRTIKKCVIYDTVKPYVLVRSMKAKSFSEYLENGDVFPDTVLIKAKDKQKVKNLFVDGVKYYDVATVTKGKHVVKVVDKAGNSRTIKFSVGDDIDNKNENSAISFFYQNGNKTIALSDGSKVVGVAFTPRAVDSNGNEVAVKVERLNNDIITEIPDNYIGKSGTYYLMAGEDASILITVSQEEKEIVLPEINCEESKYVFLPDALPVVSVVTKAAVNTEFDNFEYYLKEGYAHITKYVGSEQNISVPSEIIQNNVVYQVTIDGTPFAMNQNLKSINLFCDMKYIDCKGFFKGCENLQEVTLHSDLPYDVSEMFYDCINLKYVKGWNTFSDNVLIANKTFAFCSKLCGDVKSSLYLSEDILEKNYIFYQTAWE